MVENHEKLDQERLLFLDEGKRRLAERDVELRQEENQAVQLRGILERELQFRRALAMYGTKQII